MKVKSTPSLRPKTWSLTISKNSDLVKYGSLSKRFDCDDNSEESEEDIENEDSELTTVKNKLENTKLN